MYLLSLYIFIICAGHLGRYVNFLTNQLKVGNGIKLHKDTLKIHFLMFVDNCLVFYRTNKTSVRNIKQILDHCCLVDHYGLVLSWLVNFQKSHIRFSNGVSNAEKKAHISDSSYSDI